MAKRGPKKKYFDGETNQARWRRRHHEQNSACRAGLRKRISDTLHAIKETTPCHDCGENYPYWVMDFDHTRGSKHFSIASGNGKCWPQLWAEIEKCDLVCANCHRHRTTCRRLDIDWYPLPKR